MELKVFDAHAHAFPDAIAHKAVAALAAEGGITAYYDGTIDGLLSAMDRGGVARAVVAPVATKPSQVCGINDWMASLGEPRIVALGAIHPDFDDPVAELERIAALGIRGVKVHSQHQGFRPNDPRMAPVYEAAAALGMLVLFHAGGYVATHEHEAHPSDLAAVLDAHPSLRCIFAHMGGYQQWSEVREHLCGRDVYFDTAYVPRNLPDDAFLSLARDHGIERILFGTDGPWTDAAAEIAYLRQIGFSAAELEAILHGNAERLFGIGD
jgi:predicted TIM-barrel fold metal-dependent hydrolase